MAKCYSSLEDKPLLPVPDWAVPASPMQPAPYNLENQDRIPVAPFACPFKLPTPTPDSTAVQALTDGGVYFTCALPIHSICPPSTSPPADSSYTFEGDLLWEEKVAPSSSINTLSYAHMTTLLGCRYDQSSHTENPCARFGVIGAKLRGQWPSRHLPRILRIIWLHYDSKPSAEICAS